MNVIAPEMASWSPAIDPNSFIKNWSTILLSLRDLRRDVPINYNLYPGIALTLACFSDKWYTGDKIPCIEGLIAIGYRRFVVDLYLDKDYGRWNICPASISVEPLAMDTGPSQGRPVASIATPINSFAAPTTLLAQQTPTPLPNPITDPDTLGGYTCDTSFNTTTLFSVFESWIADTDTDLGARIVLFDFNLHETSPHSNNTDPPAPEPLIQVFQNTGVFPDAYTPVELASDRSDLNSSWFGDRAGVNTSDYFTIQGNTEKIRSTDDGWPSESYLEFVVGKRVLVSFGTIATGLGYDPVATGDNKSIFPGGYLGGPVIFNGSASPKCFFSSSDFELKDANSSWAQVIDTASSPFPEDDPDTITSLVSCGYSTILNSTYSSNLTANIEHYLDHVKAALAWSWDVNEPANTTAGENDNGENTIRCASMSASNGRWRVSDCGERKKVACRIKSRPYDWRITERDDTYYDATATCGDDDFDAPRTPLENAYLLATIKKAQLKSEDRIWIDFNSLAAEGCWVTGGENASCPYESTNPGDKEVIVSAVAAVIVLIVFGLMWFAKVGSWRVERSRRRRRKMAKKRNLEGVEYEGVPS